MTSPDQRPTPRRRFSIWTILAPVALIAVVASLLFALGQAGVVGGTDDDATTETASATTAEETTAAADGGDTTAGPCGSERRPGGYRVKPGDTESTLLEQFEMSQEAFRELNKQVTDSYTLQEGQTITVCRMVR